MKQNQSILLLFILLFSFQTFGQGHLNCADDITALSEHLKKTPSYKDQINKKDFEKQVDFLLSSTADSISELDCFVSMTSLLYDLRDNHLFLSQVPELEITNEYLTDSDLAKKYYDSEEGRNFPTTEMNLDSLEASLSSYSEKDIPGIYHYKDYLKVALFQTQKPDSLVAVMLESKLKTWKRGEIAFYLTDKGNDRFWAIHYHLLKKTLGFHKNERWIGGDFTMVNWRKNPDQPEYSLIHEDAKLYELKEINDQIQYLRLGSFGTSNSTLKLSQDFYDSIKNKLTHPNLILDLRNNGGGGFKNSRKFLKLLKKYSKSGQIYTVINQKSYSNAEQFALRLRNAIDTPLVGTSTAGTLTYGNNYGRSKTLPSGKFNIYITDMRDSGNDLKYEEIGLQPDIRLLPDRDWINQVVDLIEK